MKALQELRVVELSVGVVGPMVGMLLADHGADVVKVESPGGDPARARAGFQVWNRGKRSVVLDHPERAGAEASKLIAAADVVIVSEVVDLELWGLNLHDLQADHPSLIVLEVPPWQGPAPWLGGKESVGLLSAAVGLAMNQSSFDGGPVDLVEPQILYIQAAWGAAVTLSAILERENSGQGQVVSVSGPQALAVFAPHLLVFEPESPIALRAFGSGGPNPLYTTYEAAGGQWFFVGALPDGMRRRLLDLLDANDVLEDPRIDGDTERVFLPENSWVRERLAAIFATADRDHWLAELERIDIPAAPVLTADEWFDHPQLDALGGRISVDHPVLGTIAMPGSFFSLARTPAQVVGSAPELGASSVADIDWPSRPVPAITPVECRDSPLHGIRVVSLGAFVAGPFAGRLLAELGAEVIKIEPITGDPWRLQGFHLNDGMQSVAIDLRDERGKAALQAIIDSADAVIDNFRPGVLARLGFDHEQLSIRRPNIVTTSITGYGEVGPFAHRPGFDPVLGALTGQQWMQGGDDEPVMLSLAVNDTGAAVLAVLGTLVALRHRDRTGEGQHVSVSLAATATYLQSETFVRYEAREPVRRGGRDFRGRDANRRFYETRDGWVRVEIDRESLNCVVNADLGVEAAEFAADPVAALAARFMAFDTSEVVARLAAVGIAATRARYARHVFADAELVKAEATHEVELPDGYRYMGLGRLASLGRSRAVGSLVPPGLGEHTRQTLEKVGLSPDDINLLLRDGVAAQGGPMLPRVSAQYR